MSGNGTHRFNPAHAARLHDPARLLALPPAVLWRRVALTDAHVMVDIGAGTGLFAAEFARLAPSAVVHAVDVSAEMLDWLGSHLPEDVAGRVRPLPIEGPSVPLPAGEADVVMMIAVYHELDEAPDMLAEALRLLRAGGRLLIADWKNEPTPTGPPMEHRVSGAAIATAVSAAGFVDVDADEASLAEFAIVTATRP